MNNYGACTVHAYYKSSAQNRLEQQLFNSNWHIWGSRGSRVQFLIHTCELKNIHERNHFSLKCSLTIVILYSLK